MEKLLSASRAACARTLRRWDAGEFAKALPVAREASALRGEQVAAAPSSEQKISFVLK